MMKIAALSIVTAVYPLLALLCRPTGTGPGFPSGGLVLHGLGLLFLLGVSLFAVPVNWKAHKWNSFFPLAGFCLGITLCFCWLLTESVAHSRRPKRDEGTDYLFRLNVSPRLLEVEQSSQQSPPADVEDAAAEE